MRPLQIRVQQIQVDLDDPAAAPGVEQALRAAFQVLGERLARSTLTQDPDALSQAIALLQLDPIPSTVLIGPGGPAAVSEQLYNQISRQLVRLEARR